MSTIVSCNLTVTAVSGFRIPMTSIVDFHLSYDVAVIQWIKSYHKNRMTTCVITLWCVDLTSLTTSMSTMRFLLEILSILKVIKSGF